MDRCSGAERSRTPSQRVQRRLLHNGEHARFLSCLRSSMITVLCLVPPAVHRAATNAAVLGDGLGRAETCVSLSPGTRTTFHLTPS